MNTEQSDRKNATPSSAGISSIAAAQQDMRQGYLGGAPGALVSGLMWVMAGCVATWVSPQRAVWALFIGGMFIHPVAVLCAKLIGQPGKHSAGNPLGALAMATTIWMIMMLPLAYGISLWRIDLFFPAMLFVIGGRYLCFQMLYGMRLYWVFGAILGSAGYALASLHAAVALSAFTGGLIEIAVAFLLALSARRKAAALPAVA
ncbi:MAG TPA: hypothetical protein VGC21_20295 [Telluria sp.]|jgi:hypothetical protein